MRNVITAAVLLAVGSFAVAQSCPWPHWRGPGRDNVAQESNLLDAWPEGGPKLVWTAERVGNGNASVTLCGGKVFTMGATRGGQCVLAIEAGTGKLLWEAPVSSQRGKSNSTPSLSAGRAYAISSDGMLGCVDVETGKLAWRKHLQKDLGGGRTPGWKFAESPLVDGGRVVCTPGGEDSLLCALDKNSGEVVWRTTLPDEVRGKGAHAQYATIQPIEVDGVKQYVTLIYGLGLVGVRADDGKFLWNYRRVVNGTANISTSVAFDGHVFCSTAYGKGAALLKLSADAAREVYWLDAKTFQNHHGGMLRIGEYLYGGSGHNAGNPTCIELKTGKVMWQENQPGKGSGSVTAGDGKLVFLYQDGTVALLDAAPEACRIRSTFELARQDGPAWAHPVICRGKLYLRWGQKVFCYDLSAAG